MDRNEVGAIRVTLDEVIATCEGTEVARHRRFLGKHHTLIAPEHVRVLTAMRLEAQLAAAPPVDTMDEERDRSVYDRIGEAS